MSEENVLKAIICGYERGGTTLVNRLLVSHSDLMSGFESGFLLANKPADYLSPRYREYNGSLVQNGWKISTDDLDYICASENWKLAYSRLRERSGVVVDKSSFIFDKTPRYMRVLTDVLYRYERVPCVVVVRRPEAVICSWLKRKPGVDLNSPGRFLLGRFCHRYNDYARGYADALHHHPYRILAVSYEELCTNPEDILKQIFAHIDSKYKSEAPDFDAEYGVRGTEVTLDYVNEYEELLPEKVVRSIVRMTRKGVANLGL
jgi:hypothetical protein